jgi:prepilin-type N-terminal cleavage/methylation domain-containing protein
MNVRTIRAEPGSPCLGQEGFSLVEIVVVLGLIGILVVAVFNMVTVMDRVSRRQGLHTTMLEAAQGRLEEMRATPYNPPVSPYGASNIVQTTNIVLALNRTGSNLLSGVLKTVVSPKSQGHLVTVTVTATNNSQPMTVQLQTLVNKKSGGQP